MEFELNAITWFLILHHFKDDESEDAQRLKQFALEKLEEIRNKKGE